jgi:hypothetical protein
LLYCRRIKSRVSTPPLFGTSQIGLEKFASPGDDDVTSQSHQHQSTPSARARCGRCTGAGPSTMFLTRCVRAAGTLPSTMLLIFLGRAPKPELVIAIAEWLCLTRTCDRGSLRMANQEVTGADKAFAHGTGAGSRSHLGAGARLSRTTQARRWLALGQASRWRATLQQRTESRVFAADSLWGG